MYYLPTSCLILFFLFSFFHHFSCDSSKQEFGWCEAQFQCGNITAGFPFSGGNRRRHCGHPLLELHCDDNITSLTISDHVYHVLHIDHTSNTLRLARTNHFDYFCSSTFINATFPPEVFDLSPNYKSITFYHCNHVLADRSSYRCPGTDQILVSENPEYHHESCHASFTMNVPTSFVTKEKKVNIANLESILEQGFEVKLKIDMKACQECLSSYGSCGFNKSMPLDVKCIPPEPRTDAGLSKGVIVVIAVGASVLGLAMLILAGLFCLIRRRRKTQEAQYTSKDLPITSYSSIGAASALMGVIFTVTGLFCVISCQNKTSDDLRQQNLKALIPLKHYSYQQVKRITKSLAEVVGKGGFGTVYRGTLSDGSSVAVKILKDSKGNGEDFINEVASMSKTSHVNIVSLLGFCSEGSKRAIIYEFVENGSLDRFISRKSSMNMDRMALYSIALGIARGIEYLHHGCKTRIVHFDIKPQNILLDDNLCPKVSDFGFAKLCEKKESILSLLDTRGTIGYIAPEVFSRMYGRVSHKSDVYSYGMLLLEMIGARNKERFDQNTASNTSSMYFPEWIYKDLEKVDSGRNGISSEDEEVTKKMTVVGLWCIQPFPSDRPAINRVVEMMEGNLDALEVPPRPVLQNPPVPLQESSTFSEDISVYTEV